MKTNKLGIPIVNNSLDYHEGHSIRKYKHIYTNNNIYYYRIFRINNPYTSYLYGIYIKKYNI